MYKQKTHHKWLEVLANTVSGMIIAILITQVGDLLGFWHIALSKNVILTVTLTVVSVFRGMFWRMFFDYINLKRIEREGL